MSDFTTSPDGDRWVNAVITLVKPMDGVDPDADPQERLEYASDFFDQLVEKLPEVADMTMTVETQVVIDGEPVEHPPEIERLRQGLLDAGVPLRVIDMIQRGV